MIIAIGDMGYNWRKIQDTKTEKFSMVSNDEYKLSENMWFDCLHDFNIIGSDYSLGILNSSIYKIFPDGTIKEVFLT